jgi:hypothetical protein
MLIVLKILLPICGLIARSLILLVSDTTTGFMSSLENVDRPSLAFVGATFSSDVLEQEDDRSYEANSALPPECEWYLFQPSHFSRLGIREC